MKEDCSNDEIWDLRLSAQRVGKFYPILLDKQGNVIDGNHRIAADKDWPTVNLENVRTEKDRLLARLITNVCRRSVPSAEKRNLLSKLGEIYLQEGVHPGKVAHKIADETGMSYRWAMKYLPDTCKERPGIGGPSNVLKLDESEEKLDKCKVERLATVDCGALLANSSLRVATVKKYVNTEFVNITLEKRFYAKFEKIASKFSVSPETIINNALVMVLRQLENMCAMQSH